MAQFQIATEYFKSGNYIQAIAEYNKLPRYKEVLIQTALCYKELKKYNLAEELLNSARTAEFSDGSIDEDDTFSLHNLGSLYYTLENNLKASDYFLAAYHADNTNAEAIWNYGCTQIRRYCDNEDIDLKSAWKCYDARFYAYDLVVYHDMPYWDFKTKGKSIAVLWDQGAGDTIMFARYLNYLEEYFDEIYVQCPSGLSSLIEYRWSLYTQEIPCTYCVSITSLGRLLNYIPDGEWLKGLWKSPKNGRIGYVCSGDPKHKNDKNRSCPESYFSQYDKININGTYLDTVEELAKYDSVISVDTSIVHLCGALGMPCRVLMPLVNSDYRWGTSGSGNKWYPSVKIIRNPGIWVKCFERA